MKWTCEKGKIPIKSWSESVEPEAMTQAINLANHPCIREHVALMPDCHSGYGMPIGGVIAVENAVIPNAVGVDIACGVAAVKTNLQLTDFGNERDKQARKIRAILDELHKRVPVGEGHSHQEPQEWERFKEIRDESGRYRRTWLTDHKWDLAYKSLGTLGGGNHFLEIQADGNDQIWLMLHSGSRNVGYTIADYYNKQAMQICTMRGDSLPAKDLAFLLMDSEEGQDYIRDMQFAMDFAMENRRRMMDAFVESVQVVKPSMEPLDSINIHHNYAALEEHFGKKYWIHRKGATSARAGQTGIIPGSMGSSSYIVNGLGNPESFASCSHGAGRKMSRTQACLSITEEKAERAMKGIVHDPWTKVRRGRAKGEKDLSECPLAYKDIYEVMQAQSDLIEQIVKLRPLGVLKG